MKLGPSVVDTNVPIVANGGNERVSSQCRLCTIEFLEEMMHSGTLVVDFEGLVEKEYFDNLRFGYPGVGNRFIQHFFATAANRIERLPLGEQTEQGFDDLNFRGALKNFDKSDRKFATLAHIRRCPVYVSVDTDWAISKDALTAAGVEVNFLCGENQKDWFS
jgi:hypothetical protein